MHLGNGIICPVTGIPMLVIAGATAFYAYKNVKKDFSKDKISLAVTLTGLVFALQMINFAIPTTGSSGHIVGGILLAALLDPYAAFLAMCAILIVQAVFFADGGLLALGCNIFNMGILACFVAYPLIYKPLEKVNKPVLASILASVAALQIGAFAVVIESVLSNSISLSNLANFAGLMQTIHLPIGFVEGAVTGLIVILAKRIDAKKLSYSFGIFSIIFAAIISQYASQKPDGLEWSLLNMSDKFVAQTQWQLFNIAETIQAKTAILTQIPQIAANITGLLFVMVSMLFVCSIISRKMVKENAE